jgi:hypothetical protein
MFVHEKKELELIRVAVEKILQLLAEFKEQSVGKPDHLFLKEDSPLNKYYLDIYIIFLDKLQGKINKDLTKVMKYEQSLLEDLLKEGFSVSKDGLFFKKYNLEKYLFEQIERVVGIMDTREEELTIKEFTKLSKDLTVSLKVVLKLVDKLLVHYDEYKKDTNKSLEDIKHLKRVE